VQLCWCNWSLQGSSNQLGGCRNLKQAMQQRLCQQQLQTMLGSMLGNMLWFSSCGSSPFSDNIHTRSFTLVVLPCCCAAGAQQ
jgi:hypothetical protein